MGPLEPAVVCDDQLADGRSGVAVPPVHVEVVVASRQRDVIGRRVRPRVVLSNEAEPETLGCVRRVVHLAACSETVNRVLEMAICRTRRREGGGRTLRIQ